MSAVLYRIAWRAIETGATGNGDYCLSFDNASKYIKDLNSDYKNSIVHWIEAMPSVSEPLPPVPSSSSPSVEEPFHQQQ